MAGRESNGLEHFYADFYERKTRNLNLKQHIDQDLNEFHVLERKYIMMEELLIDIKIHKNEMSKMYNYMVDVIGDVRVADKELRHKIDVLKDFHEEMNKRNEKKATEVQELKDKIAATKKEIHELKNKEQTSIEFSKDEQNYEENGAGDSDSDMVVDMRADNDYMDFMQNYFRRGTNIVSSTVHGHDSSDQDSDTAEDKLN
ncbi:uncharacterized protein LOC116343712 [Contarinia nasturtii]|uniref:uncharacterized protein LOC116343712 n=1 Tax=Contarinia nasturtii TaxID=265458 RepID=UPI0012D495A1|nr:uncharacterized protein LOC116343712 [Contarinia nasturtii]